MTDIRSCPCCRRSVRADAADCPRCGQIVNLKVRLTTDTIDEVRETILDIPIVNPDHDGSEP